MSTGWISTAERLPNDGQRVLCWLPVNEIYLPGKTGAMETRHVVILKFAEDFFMKNPSRTATPKHPHFWLGEGSSNHFFEAVSHWMPLPAQP